VIKILVRKKFFWWSKKKKKHGDFVCSVSLLV